MENVLAAARRFSEAGRVLAVREYGSGNINDTFLVTLDAGAFILQRINRNVFPEPELIIRNLRMILDHMAAHPQPGSNSHVWVMPDIIQTCDGADYALDDQGNFWRALTFIAGAQTHPRIRTAAHAREVGYALGRFQRLLSDLPPELLSDTLKGFHIVPQYLQRYDAVLRAPAAPLTNPEAQYCLHIIETRRIWGAVLENARAQGILRLRAIHGDPKVDNILIDDQTGRAVSLIDLDTVKPGLVHYDIGDCLRSGCNPPGEDAESLADVRFDLDLCRAILEGYLSEARHFLVDDDYVYLYDAVRLMAFEMGLRFFSDYLAGNVYFKVRDAQHNLRRAMVQCCLLEHIEALETDIRAIIQGAFQIRGIGWRT